MLKKPTKKAIKDERSPTKLKKVLEKKGFPNGEIPDGKEAHHVKPVAEGGKTTTKNIIVIKEEKHKKIHKNKRK